MKYPQIKILDCTLRDGGYVNGWEFKDEYIIKIAKALQSSNADILEWGYLNDKAKDKDSTLFKDLSRVNFLIQNLHKTNENAKKPQNVVMINLNDFDLKKLKPKNESLIDGIRLAFHKEHIDEALEAGKIIKNLGYKLYFQAMVSKRYKDLEFLELINKTNALKPKAFYIVDSFGSMNFGEFNTFCILSHNNLAKDITLGFHAHNNMQLAFANALHLCNANLKRKIILDCSVYGMGRGAGNLHTELIMDYLNAHFNGTYKSIFLLELIDHLLAFFKSKFTWGFSLAQYLSASLNMHPNYASYLVSKKQNSLKSIKTILEKIPEKNRASYNEKLIEKLFLDEIFKPNSTPKGELVFTKPLLLIAPGSSVLDFKEKITKQSANATSIAINHKSIIECDFCFFSNQKRYDEFKDKIDPQKTIITSNILTQSKVYAVLDIKKLVFVGKYFSTNASLIFLNFLSILGIKDVKIAGFDGLGFADKSYCYDETDINTDLVAINEANEATKIILALLEQKIKVEFLTPSFYKDSK